MLTIISFHVSHFLHIHKVSAYSDVHVGRANDLEVVSVVSMRVDWAFDEGSPEFASAVAGFVIIIYKHILESVRVK